MRQGVELAGSVPLGQMFTLSGAYTYTDARRPDGTRIGLVPFHDLTLSLDAALGARLEAGLSVKHVAGRLDDFASFAMPDYTVVGAQASYELSGGAEAYLRVENLFDETYETSSGYAASPRAIYAGLRATF